MAVSHEVRLSERIVEFISRPQNRDDQAIVYFGLGILIKSSETMQKLGELNNKLR